MDLNPKYIITYEDADGKLFEETTNLPVLDSAQAIQVILELNRSWNNGHGAGHVFIVKKIEKVSRCIIFEEK